MKKTLSLIAAFCVLSLLCGCSGGRQEASIGYGKSALFSQSDMDSAINVITDEFSTWEGCTLYCVDYAGDEACGGDNLDYCNSLSDGTVYTECIVFTSAFHTPSFVSGGFEPDETYSDWSWYLARENAGEWVLLTYGYA